MPLISCSFASLKHQFLTLRSGHHAIWALVFLICSHLAGAQEPSDSTERHTYLRLLPVPAFGYEPETDWYFGGVVLFNFDLYNDTTTRPSNLSLEFNYTLRKQRILDAGWDWFSARERWYSEGYVEWSFYPDYYFGVGPEARASERLLFESERLIFDLGLYRSFAPAWYAGIFIQYANYSGLDKRYQDDFQELRNASLMRLAPALRYDSRNSLLKPSQGAYWHLLAGNTWSTKNYWLGLFDARKYFTTKLGVMSLRFLSRFVGQGAPFFDLSVMGGDQAVRGYFYGRYRDDGFSTAQAEWRSPQWKRCGMALFGGYSMLYNGFPTTAFGSFENYGAGLRYLIDRKGDVNLRFDYARGKNGESGFYIGFGESF